MKWNNLLRNKCPKCGWNLWYDKDEPYILCPKYECGWMCPQWRMAEIVSKLLTRRLDWDSDLEGSEEGGVDNSLDN